MSSQAKRALLLTGRPGVGKTTLIRRLAEALPGRSIAGFYTEEIRKAGMRLGFRLVTFEGDAGVIAHLDLGHRYTVGKYGVDVAALDRFADKALTRAGDIDLYIVDEIGKMECLSPRFTSAIRTLLDTDKLFVATVAKHGSGPIAEVKARPGCDLWEVTRANRDTLVFDALAWLQERL